MSHPETSRKARLEDYNIMDPALLECPFHHWAHLRDEAPVFRDPLTGIYLVSTYDLVCELNNYPEVFSSKPMRPPGQSDPASEVGFPPMDTLLTADPPEHTRYRKLVNKTFSQKRVKEMEGDIERISNDLIDKFIDESEVEFVSAFAQALPLTVIAGQLGVPMTDHQDFRRWSDAAAALISRMASEEEQKAAIRDLGEWRDYFTQKLEEKAANPTNDIISDLTQVTLAEEGDARKLDPEEQLSIIQQIFVAGNETTAKALTEAMYQLISHPDQMRDLQSDPSLMLNAVNETLRILTSSNNMFRVTTEDTELGGVSIPKGSAVMVKYGSANRDEAMFDAPDTFNIHRDNASFHVAFGKGIHTCLGNALARKEMMVGLTALFSRATNWRFPEGKNEFHYPPNFLLRGMTHLVLAFDKL